jgi:hypothetical protein
MIESDGSPEADEDWGIGTTMIHYKSFTQASNEHESSWAKKFNLDHHLI